MTTPRVTMILGQDEAPMRLAHDFMNIERPSFGSVREFDEFGRLHVKVSNISKANICPYYGREIPNSEALGLEPNRMYRLWRSPEELLKSVGTWNNVPLMDLHVANTADSPQKDRIVGSAGTDAEFSDPYLRNSLVIWDGGAIALVEADDPEEQVRQLSCGYRYVADMTPGTIEGEQYDGVMRNIVGNHIALVREGRAGADVVVGDSKPVKKTKGDIMIKTTALRSRKALMAQGALVAYLAPRLAADAQIDLSPVLKGINASNFKRATPAMLRTLVKITDGKLAADADLDEAAELLEQVDRTTAGGKDEIDDKVDTSSACDEEEDEEKKKDAEDASEDDDDDDMDAKDEEEDDKKVEAKDKGAKDVEPDDKKEEDKGGAMDAAIAKAVSRARRETLAAIGQIDAAKAAVRPIIGEVTGPVSSATQVYKMALDAKIEGGADIDLDGVHPSAYPAILAALVAGGQKTPRPSRERLAGDAAATKSFADAFPAAADVRHV